MIYFFRGDWRIDSLLPPGFSSPARSSRHPPRHQGTKRAAHWKRRSQTGYVVILLWLNYGSRLDLADWEHSLHHAAASQSSSMTRLVASRFTWWYSGGPGSLMSVMQILVKPITLSRNVASHFLLDRCRFYLVQQRQLPSWNAGLKVDCVVEGFLCFLATLVILLKDLMIDGLMRQSYITKSLGNL